MKHNNSSSILRNTIISVLSILLATVASAQTVISINSTTTGTISPGTFQHYKITVPNTPSGWLLNLERNGNGGNLDLFVQRDTLPTSSSFLRRSQNARSHEMAFFDSEIAAGECYIVSAFLPASATADVTFDLTSVNTTVTTLEWDPGTARDGTNRADMTNVQPGDYIFRLTTENTNLGVWRTILNVSSGEANLYLSQDELRPTNNATQSSTQTGSDGIVRSLSSTNGVGQDWFIRVEVTETADFSLFSGNAFVTDLGSLQATSASSSDLLTMNAGGIEFFKTELPLDLLAWRLWTRTNANETIDSTVLTRAGNLPFNTSGFFEQRFSGGQGLLVDEQFDPQPGQLYYIAVQADPGTEFLLDNRSQDIPELTFGNTVTVSSDGFNYRTFRVEVPIDQLAWETISQPISGNPQFFVSRDVVPNATHKDFTSISLPGDGSEMLTLVPDPTPNSRLGFSDGTFYISLFSETEFEVELTSREPEITDIAFDSTTVNDAPDRAGWRFYRVLNNESLPGNQQLGQLGWQLDLEGDVEDTELFIRRVNVPGSNSALFDQSSTVGRLQDPDREADTWYIGVFRADSPLGAFTLRSRPINPTTLTIDDSSRAFTDLPAKTWGFAKVIVPATISGEDVLGWEIRATNWTGARPDLIVRRASLPEELGNRSPNGSINVQRDTTFSDGQQLQGGNDWTRRQNQPSGIETGADRLLTLPMGNPLEPGTYYVGVRNSSNSEPLTVTLESRAIGVGMGLNVQDLTLGESAAITDLDARDVAYYRIAASTPPEALRFALNPTTLDGEVALYLRQNFIPSSLFSGSPTARPFEYDQITPPSQTFLNKLGAERTILLPGSNTITPNRVASGVYFAMVVSEGVAPPNTSTIGNGSISATLEATQNIDIENLGELVSGAEISRLVQTDIEVGETRFYSFDIGEDVPGVTVAFESLDNSNTRLDFSSFEAQVIPAGATGYGIVQGASSEQRLSQRGSFTLSDLDAGTYILTVRNGSTSVAPSFNFSVTGEAAETLAFDAGANSVTGLEPGRWKYFAVTVPADIAGEPVLGWDLRLTDWGSPSNTSRPQIELRRELFPDGTGTSVSSSATEFLVGNRLAFGNDWTDRTSC